MRTGPHTGLTGTASTSLNLVELNEAFAVQVLTAVFERV